MRKFLVLSGIVIFPIVMPVSSYAQVSQCSDAIRYNNQEIQNNIALKYLMSQTITSSNFEERKKDGSANAVVDNLPVGASFDDYSKAVSSEFSSIDQKLFLNLSSSMMQRVIAPGSFQAYERCIAAVSNEPVSAWISGATKTSIMLSVRTNLPSGEEGLLSIDTDQPAPDNHKEVKVSGAGSQTIFFHVNSDQEFNAIVNLQKNGVAYATATPITVPALLNIVRVPHTKELTDTQVCKAGDRKSTRGNLTEPISYFNAEQGAALQHNLALRVLENPESGSGCSDMNQVVLQGSGDYAQQWTSDDKSMHVKILCEGSAASTHTQACAKYQLSITQLSYSYELQK